ncbi:MAG: PLP-dependent transferase, partial [Fimbriimonadaceae bacterium]|nr:PLP-dependent transferase [Alphaproteobacteria bacterium]
MVRKSKGLGTRITHGGGGAGEHHGFVNTPVYRGSTVLFENTAALHDRTVKYLYGRRGTPTTDSLIELITDLEGGENTILTSSGLSAITTTLLALLGSGDHLLMVDSVYRPNRLFCNTVLTRLGVEIEYYDPLIGAGISAHIKENTRVIFLETPGSQTFEMQDIPAIINAVKSHPKAADIFTVADNTWATGMYYRPLVAGVDISVQACTKYVVGHSDAMLGAATANARAWPLLRQSFENLGVCPGSEETFLGTRGMRTLEVRLRQHMTSAIEVATWLQ